MKAGDLQLWVFAAGCAAKLRVMGLLVPLLEGSIVLLLGAWVHASLSINTQCTMVSGH